MGGGVAAARPSTPNADVGLLLPGAAAGLAAVDPVLRTARRGAGGYWVRSRLPVLLPRQAFVNRMLLWAWLLLALLLLAEVPEVVLRREQAVITYLRRLSGL